MRALLAGAVLASADALMLAHPGVVVASSSGGPRVRMAEQPDLDSPFLKAVNLLQETIQTSPVAKLKSSLAKLQAGAYDEAATREKLEQLVAQPAVMFSFST